MPQSANLMKLNESLLQYFDLMLLEFKLLPFMMLSQLYCAVLDAAELAVTRRYFIGWSSPCAVNTEPLCSRGNQPLVKVLPP